MNTVEPLMMLSPSGKEEECAKFTITNVGQYFTLSGTAAAGEEYTFSCWVKSDSDGSITVSDNTIQSTDTWTRHSVTFVASIADVFLRFRVTGTYYIYHPMLEIGNKASDWTPAPEDIDDSVKQMSSDISGINTDLRTWTSRLGRHFEFSTDSDDAAITITVGNNALSLELDPESGIVFKKNDERFGLWNGENFYTGNIVIRTTERAQFGNFAYIPRTDGGLSFLKVAGE